MGFTPLENILCSRLRNVAFMVGDMEQIRTLAAHRRSRCRLHLKVDTGLHRHGVAPSEFNEALHLVTGSPGLELEGICSHFADASGSNTAFTKAQLTRWNRLVEPHRNRVRYLHTANTAGIAWTQEAVVNVARVGLGLYGYDTYPSRSLSLKPALSIQSRLQSLRTINPGERVGYGLTWQASEVTTLALIPTGYNACVDHRLSNKGAFRIEGAVCPIVGRVCMNTTMINIAQARDAKPGQVVEIIASDPGAVNSVSKIANICDTTPHVVLSGISPLLRRVIVE
jgi:alanine racemase